MPLLAELKEYLRIDGEDEESTLKTFLSSAITTLVISGVKQPKNYYLVVDGNDVFALHRLAVCNLAAHYYENRQAVSNNAQNQVPFSVQTMILQLKWVDPDVYESGTI